MRLDRRGFLAMSAAAGLGEAASAAASAIQEKKTGPRKLRLSVTWGMMRSMPVPDALAKLNELGYDAYEMFNWRDEKTLAQFEQERKKYTLECSTLISNKGVSAPGCGLVNPAEREQFLKEIEACALACKRVGCKEMLTLTGNDVPGMSREAMMESAVAGLKAAVPILEKHDLTASIEILNTLRDHRGYFIHFVRDGAALIDAVDSPHVKLTFDIYHVQIMEGNLITNIRNNIRRISHFHIGDHPGRHQPGTGEINYRNVFKAIVDLGYTGTAALEYSPTVPMLEDLIEMRKMTQFS